jgi:hypothetical protein
MTVSAPEDYWAPIRKALAENLLGYIPELDVNGAVTGPTTVPGLVTTKPVVTYISRQGAGRRLTDKDHEGLVEALRGLEKEGLCEVHIPLMERMSLQDQIALPAKSTVSLSFYFGSSMRPSLTWGYKDHRRCSWERPYGTRLRFSL